MKIYGKTDTGITRAHNQDAYINTLLAPNAVLSVVCDGMGGANAGNVASEMAVRIITDYIKNSYRDDMDSLSAQNLLRSAISTANLEIYDAALKNPDYSGMGTTAVAALVINNKAYIAHVGDSRAYLLSDTIVQITRDHSMIQSLIEKGHLTAEEARSHPRKNVITRAVGIAEDVQCDFNEVDISGKQLLICTDGLNGMLSNDEIFIAVRQGDADTAPQRLIDSANEKGSTDNVTVTLIDRL